MASSWSPLKIELIATGEQSGIWGNTTNTNLGTALEEAITGSATVTFSSADVTLTLTDTNSSQTARNLRLDLGGTSGGARSLIVPAIEKQYIVRNGCADAVTVKNSTGTGIAVPSGKTMVLFNDATNVVDVTTYLSSLTLGSALPIASGGTGETTRQAALDALAGAVTSGQYLRGNGTDVVMSTIQAADVPTLNQNTTGSAGSLSATLGVSAGGTGQTSYTDGQLLIGNTSGNTLTKSTLTGSTGVTVTNGGGTITLTPTSGYNGFGARTVSTGSPTGGSDGDIWYKY
jgi:hypothetical protein